MKASGVSSSGSIREDRLQRSLGVRTLVAVRNIEEQIPGRSSAEIESMLWQRSLAGDGDAFGLLFDRHRDRVLRHAFRLAGSRQDAEDVVASAFLELWRLRHRVRLVDGSVLPWLLATTTNVGLNAARSRRRYQRFLERLPRTGQQPDVAETASAAGIDPLVREAMRSLRPKDAQLLALVALEGYPVDQAAGCLQLSPEAARSRLHRARRRLRDVLGKEPAFKLVTGEEGL
jgi:RNA polymerase sigma factor (sigma-70 family)